MAGKTNYPGGFSGGVTIRGVPIDVPNPGEVFFVNSTTVIAKGGVGSSDGNPGTYQKPFATVDFAIGKCTADRGDVIYVMPGHVEEITGAGTVDCDVAGVSIIGLGRGSKQCRFDFTATASTVLIDADNVSIVNMNFHANVPAVVIGLSVITLATDSLVQDCTFTVETTTTDEFVIGINYAAGCNNFIVDNCIIDQGLGGAATGIKLVSVTAGGNIRNCRIVGDYTFACIGSSGTTSTEIYIEDNVLTNGGSANVGIIPVISMAASGSGLVRGNTCLCNVATGAAQMVSTGMFFSDNWHGEDAGSAATCGMSRGIGNNIVSIVPFADG